MDETNVVTVLDVLDLFYEESMLLKKVVGDNFIPYVIGENELWDADAIFYKDVNPIIERGIFATLRLILVKVETISFHRVCGILISDAELTKEQIADIEQLKKEFNTLRVETNELFDLFWNVDHLHKDIKDERFMKYFNLMHSCSGPSTVASLYDSTIKFNDLITKLNELYVLPYLKKMQRVHV